MVGGLTFCASPAVAQVRVKYLYSLADFSGQLRYDWSRVQADAERNEIYVLYQNVVRIFTPSGMETFSFGDDLALGQILDAVVDAEGNIVVFSYNPPHWIVTRCNFRGVPLAPIEIRNLPAGVVFSADRMFFRNGIFYFVSLTRSSVIITDASGEFKDHIEFLPLIDAEEKKKNGAEVMGFAVDGEGNMFFTVPVLFRVFKLSRDGTLTSFGRSGSAPGRFGVVAGITTDSQGDILVSDKVRSVVMIFAKDFRFITEFGYRGERPESLIAPDDLAVDQRDRLYVSQGRKRGISVFALTRD